MQRSATPPEPGDWSIVANPDDRPGRRWPIGSARLRTGRLQSPVLRRRVSSPLRRHVELMADQQKLPPPAHQGEPSERPSERPRQSEKGRSSDAHGQVHLQRWS